jgi:hypothetical protein
MWAVVLLRGAIGLIPVLVLELIWLPDWWYSFSIAVVTAGALGLITLLRRRRMLSYNWWSPVSRNRGRLSTAERLVCIGDSIELDEFTGIDGNLREPRIFRALRISYARLQWGLLLVGPTVWVATINVAGPGQLPRILVLLGTLCACVLLAHLPRDYYRVVPWRLDKLSFRLARSTVDCRQSWNLQDARITCNLAKRWMEIRPAPADGHAGADTPEGEESLHPLRLSLRRFDEPHAFALAVFQAAVCERARPPLPCGGLVG